MRPGHEGIFGAPTHAGKHNTSTIVSVIQLDSIRVSWMLICTQSIATVIIFFVTRELGCASMTVASDTASMQLGWEHWLW